MVTLAPPLHPAERRRLNARMPDPPRHDVVLRPLGSTILRQYGSPARRDLILTSPNQKFLEVLLSDLVQPDWPVRLDAMRDRRRGSDGVLELHLPTHRRTQIVLYEVVCQTPGTPRLDPARITGLGMVVRRRGAVGWEGWMNQGGRRLGWRPANEQPDFDPSPAQRRTSHKANAAIRAAIAKRKGLADDIAEEVITLFVAPPDVCKALGKTVIMGVLPVTSMEFQDGPAPALNYGALPAADRQAMIDHLSSYLKQRAQTPMPRAGELLSRNWNVLGLDGLPSDEVSDPVDRRLKSFGIFLHQFAGELDATSATPSAAATRLMQLMASIALPLAKDSQGRVTASVDAATFVRQAIPILIEGSVIDNATVRMPLEWPAIGQALGRDLSAAALDCLSARSAALSSAPTKYEEAEDQFAVRAFIRQRGHGDCPDQIHWGDYSEPFRILPWWDGDGPGIKIKLPSMAKLRRAKPDVSFEVPPTIAAILQGDMKKLAKGEDGGKGLEIGWICSFSLPIITLCAFICLNIFLSLLDIIFSWMLWVKVCLPIPKKASD
jgi:hypothetical protein